MSLRHSSINDIALGDVGFVLTWIVTLGLLIPIQLASMIVFDESGLDTFAPSFVFMVIVPALLLTFVPTLAARRLYTYRAARATAAVAFAIFAIVTGYTSDLYGLCGPGC